MKNQEDTESLPVPEAAGPVLRCVLIEDDRLSARIMASLIEQSPRLRLVQTFETGQAGLTALLADPGGVDLLFLDVELTDMDGLELLAALEHPPLTILTTAKDNYALKAFEHRVLDYLLKPVKPARFHQAVNVAIKTIDERTARAQPLVQAPPAEAAEDTKLPHLFVRSDNQFVKVNFDELLWIEAKGDYVQVVLERQRSFSVHARMMDFENRLPADRFMRVHRSFIVNITKISVLQEGIVVIGQKVIPTSKVNRAKLNKRLNIID
jgi:DNA-binding LytR/AlgR family response regulator